MINRIVAFIDELKWSSVENFEPQWNTITNFFVPEKQTIKNKKNYCVCVLRFHDRCERSQKVVDGQLLPLSRFVAL